ncbi:M16 peptidase-like protein [Aureococcus anophagefferens]|nr:M16 peptidase-like protein [Aureococcus anophagefferens]
MSDTIPTMKLKLHRVDGSLEVRRVGLRANTLEALRAAVDATFPDLEGKYDLLYVDADGDTCTLKTDEELAISFIARSDGAAVFHVVPSRAPASVHVGVTCDDCGMSPIRGFRFKCTVRPDYDLCGRCDARDPESFEDQAPGEAAKAAEMMGDGNAAKGAALFAELRAKAAEAMRDGDADTDVMAEMAKKFQEREGADGEPPCAFMAEMAEKWRRRRGGRRRRRSAWRRPSLETAAAGAETPAAAEPTGATELGLDHVRLATQASLETAAKEHGAAEEAKEPPAPPAEAASPSSEWEEFISSDTAGVFEALKQLEEMGFVAKNGFEDPSARSRDATRRRIITRKGHDASGFRSRRAAPRPTAANPRRRRDAAYVASAGGGSRRWKIAASMSTSAVGRPAVARASAASAAEMEPMEWPTKTPSAASARHGAPCRP